MCVLECVLAPMMPNSYQCSAIFEIHLKIAVRGKKDIHLMPGPACAPVQLCLELLGPPWFMMIGHVYFKAHKFVVAPCKSCLRLCLCRCRCRRCRCPPSWQFSPILQLFNFCSDFARSHSPPLSLPLWLPLTIDYSIITSSTSCDCRSALCFVICLDINATCAANATINSINCILFRLFEEPLRAPP